MTTGPVPPPLTLEAWSNLIVGMVLGNFDGEAEQLTAHQSELITYAIKTTIGELWSIRPPEQHV
jgi:hypothetical protein